MTTGQEHSNAGPPTTDLHPHQPCEWRRVDDAEPIRRIVGAWAPFAEQVESLLRPLPSCPDGVTIPVVTTLGTLRRIHAAYREAVRLLGNNEGGER